MTDGCIVNTIKAICKMYNEDFKYYKNFRHIDWWEINTWNFEECNCAKPSYIDSYFNQPRFFRYIEYMDYAKEILDELKETYKISIVSASYSPNLYGKSIWIKENLPYCDFIGVNLKQYKNKGHIDMSNGIFIDDSYNNLITSNAMINSRPDHMITATHGNREYSIRDYQMAVDYRNYDDSTTYWTLNLCSERII